jgi:flagellar biosynthesis chaperone FliJ
MSAHRKVAKGETLHRIRALQERAQKAQTLEADREAQRRQREAHTRREALRSLDASALREAEEGVSMHRFMRYQGLRDIHNHALSRAQSAHKDAVDALHGERAALQDAVQSRRAAERLLENARQRLNQERRRKEQRQVDEITCARAALGGAL